MLRKMKFFTLMFAIYTKGAGWFLDVGKIQVGKFFMLYYMCDYILKENLNVKIIRTFTLYCMCRFNPGSGTGDEYKASKNFINKPD